MQRKRCFTRFCARRPVLCLLICLSWGQSVTNLSNSAFETGLLSVRAAPLSEASLRVRPTPLRVNSNMIHPSKFHPPWWARNPHVQTVLAKVLQRARIKYRKERLELPDGDFVDLAWGLPEQDDHKPLVVLFHGLEGNIESH